jgi:hypothetical protein
MDTVDFFRNQYHYIMEDPVKNNQHAIECIERWIPQLEDMIELHVFGICTKTDCRKCRADRMLVNMKELLNLCRAAPNAPVDRAGGES